MNGVNLKIRLDELVVLRGIAENLDIARAMIMSGSILVDNVCEDKIGMKFDDKKEIRLKSTKKTQFVSRGGLKLQKALDYFSIDVTEKKCMDIGCSTGGFTDLLLRRGAKTVYAVDVGSGQLDWKLRNDDRVVVLEKTNVRYLEKDSDISDFDFICVDVSFISITNILDKIVEFSNKNAEIVFLIKPQFEANKEDVDDGGIVNDKAVHEYVVEKINNACRSKGLENIGVVESPIKGAKGNVEFLAYYRHE